MNIWSCLEKINGPIKQKRRPIFWTFFFLVVAVIMLLVSFYYINQLEWDVNISLFEGLLDALHKPMPFQ